MSERQDEISRLLHSAAEGSRRAEELLPLVYDELRALARARMAKEAPGQTLQATGLVHEAYLRVIGKSDPGWNGRGHFFGAASRAMRRILVEQARRKGRVRHGGGRGRVDVDDVDLALEGPKIDLLAIDESLDRLEQRDSRKSQIVHLRFFAGLTAQETADVMELSLGTIEREWRFIKAWLQTELPSPGS